MADLPALNRFQKLIDDISNLYVKARNMQVRFGWETGRRLFEEEQNGAMRAAYGSKLVPKVSQVLIKKYGAGFSESNLRKMRRFYLLNPIQSTSTELDWSDHVELLPVKDAKIRERLQARVLKEGLSSVQLRRLVQKVRDVSKKTSSLKLPPLKRPDDLKLATFAKSTLNYKLPADYVLMDCGFTVNWPVKKEELKTIVVTDKPSYTYQAMVDRVIDGDTLSVVIEVGFEIKVRDRLRLRGIDTPELGTLEGERAKKYVESLLPAGSTIIVKSHKSRVDSHGRFVVDVFYRDGVSDPQAILKDAVYLNQQLLDQGYASRMSE